MGLMGLMGLMGVSGSTADRLKADFSTNAAVHQLAYLFWVVVVRLQEHQLGDGTLYGRVVATDHASLLQLEARIVAVHLYAALQTLADVDDDLAIARTFF